MARHRTYSRHTQEAIVVLGKQIALGRKRRRMTSHDFAERVGISRTTLHKIESGDPRCEIGIVLEAATIAGVPLFAADSPGALRVNAERLDDRLALLPKAIRHAPEEVDDDF